MAPVWRSNKTRTSQAQLVAVWCGRRVVNVISTSVWLTADRAIWEWFATDVLASGLKLADAVDLVEFRARAAHGPVEAVPVAMIGVWSVAKCNAATWQPLRSKRRKVVMHGETLNLRCKDGLGTRAHQLSKGDGPRLHIIIVEKASSCTFESVNIMVRKMDIRQ